ncbi:dihydrolipoyl dehydrogenase family protein [Catenuloplanes indicus]|uniref:Dihydrolipoamide dehydrogenase n=1 Tax=Catenuloplanes indicus TaxID=137267 RepID=A0AAE3VVW9_9ACTN|nr:NAD(P)/FAD-dependent oxidoreductase [Catenuloplanes indicus]MDQ0364304.1 dihydrolipoamide dehydrogenase [Catenuloplanes indicus]
MNAYTYDVVVIGAGPAGENVADRAVKGGLTAAIVERELVGGECSYWACMPTKALLRSAAARRAALSVPGVPVGELDPAAVLRRRDEFAAHWADDGQVGWLEQAGIALHRGTGRIVADRVVQVGDDRLTARHAVVVATGTSAFVPDIPGLRDISPWTSREAAAATSVPGRLAIIGGGVVATEMATAFAALGSSVTLLARSGVLGGFEPFAGERVVESLRESGVTVRLGAAVTAARRDPGGTVQLMLADDTVVAADEVLVATGRTPNTEDGAFITVDDTMRANDWLYAVGDVNGRALLTHQGKYQARLAGDAIVARAHGKPVRHVDAGVVPQVVFTDPEIASVGLTAAAAAEAGLRTRVVDYDLGAVAGASLHADGYRGHARMVVDEDRSVIVGFTLAGSDVAELLHAATIAIVGEIPLDRLWHAVPAYPTVSEVWLRLLENYPL